MMKLVSLLELSAQVRPISVVDAPVATRLLGAAGVATAVAEATLELAESPRPSV